MRVRFYRDIGWHREIERFADVVVLLGYSPRFAIRTNLVTGDVC
jgi:hypothetical protein